MTWHEGVREAKIFGECRTSPQIVCIALQCSSNKMKFGKDKLGKEPEPCCLVSARMLIGFESFEIFTTDPGETVGNSQQKIATSEDDELGKRGYMRYAGLFFALLASLVLSLGALIVKTIQSSERPYHTFNVSTWRFQGVLVPSLAVFFYQILKGNSSAVAKGVRKSDQPGVRRNVISLVLRGVVGGAYVLTQTYALQYLSLADSTVIVFSTPVFVAYLAHFILGEPLGIIPVLASIFTLGGVVVITRPPFLTGAELSMGTMIGIGIALSSMLCGCCMIILLRYLREVSTILTTTTFGAIGTFVCIGLAVGFGAFELPQGRDDWIFCIAIGILNYLGQVFFTLALQYEEAGPVSLVRTGDVIFSFLWQFIFLGIAPDAYSLVGATIIISGVIVMGIRKLIQNLPETNETRRRFWFLLI